MISRQGYGWLRRACAGTLLLPLAACVVLPRQDPEDASCRLVTHSYSLQVASVGNTSYNCSGDARGCLVMLAIIPAGSVVVSGSIVAAGDTVHWIERQGRCSDSATQQAVAGLQHAGGAILNTAGDVVHWLHGSARPATTASAPAS